MARIKKSSVLNGFSYHFNDDKLIGIVNNADSAYPKALDPKSDLFSRLAAEDVALAKYNILKYGLKAYLPEYRDCHLPFMKDLLLGVKDIVYKKDVKATKTNKRKLILKKSRATKT